MTGSDTNVSESMFTADDRFRQKSAIIGTIFFEFVCTLFGTLAENDSDDEVDARIDNGLQIRTISMTLASISIDNVTEPVHC